eukprot:TRINITY_DN47543_c0_g1_i1.p1 TRINITY_DN47543_c0_g1~~TRINITY_DN47543_c0_g1_i1.p1  ORF type:complete len:409 (+),score=84.47 TRINITY_DN47543_c0_g1_i1:93-1319(+)
MSDNGFGPAELAAGCSFEAFCKNYRRSQAVLIKGCVAADQKFGLEQLSELQERWPAMVQQTFSMESTGSMPRRTKRKRRKLNTPHPTASSMLGPDAIRPKQWYASFIVQENDALHHVLQLLPCAVPPFLGQEGLYSKGKLPTRLKGRKRRRTAKHSRGGPEAIASGASDLVSHNASAWLFFGENNDSRPMPGRPEHTDKMKHHGTWHVQVSGSKVWHLRATVELLEAAGVSCDDGQESLRHVVHCEAGDVLVVNTRLWWHRTELPGLLADATGPQLSLSYARDFVISAAANGAAAAVRVAASAGRLDEDDDDMEEPENPGIDVNVDGVLATEIIETGSVIMMADDMPKRKQNVAVPAPPNCMVRDLPDGSGEALVALKNIASGDLFLVLGYESDDEDPELQHMRTFVV